MRIKKIKDKRGWVRIVEAFVAILLITGVVLIILNKGFIEKKDISDKIYEAELSILREIQTNSTLREEVIKAGALPIEWYDTTFPEQVKDKITERTPDYLNCVAKICEADKLCLLEEYQEQDIFAESIIISSILEQGQSEQFYRQLKLFCWTK